MTTGVMNPARPTESAQTRCSGRIAQPVSLFFLYSHPKCRKGVNRLGDFS